MLDKILMAARKIAARNKIHTLPTERPAWLGTTITPNAVIETDVEAFVELVRLVDDYFNPGRSESHCKNCNAPLVWIKTGRGANAPLDAAWVGGLDESGVHRRIRISHFATCPKAKDHTGR